MALNIRPGLEARDLQHARALIDEILRYLQVTPSGSCSGGSSSTTIVNQASSFLTDGFLEFIAVTSDVDAPVDGRGRLYLYDTGSSFELRIRFATGSPQTIGAGGVSNQPPVASIDSISPAGSSEFGAPVDFAGSGTDPDVGGSVVGYRWFSSISGDFSTAQNVNAYTSLPAGDHIISLVVTDNAGADSPAVTQAHTVNVAVNVPPVAQIDDVSPASVLVGETITFTGSGNDPDGSIAAYEWTSDIQSPQELSTAASFNTSALIEGFHTILFRVQDNEGAWSPYVGTGVTVGPLVSGVPERLIPWAADAPTTKNFASVTPVDSSTHPYLLMNSSDVPAIRAKIAIMDSPPAKAWESVVQNIDNNPNIDVGKRISAMAAWTLRYLVEETNPDTYGQQAHAAMKTFHDRAQRQVDANGIPSTDVEDVRRDWEGKYFANSQPVPTAVARLDHGFGRVLFNFAIGYDQLMPYLVEHEPGDIQGFRNSLALQTFRMYEGAINSNSQSQQTSWKREYMQNHFTGCFHGMLMGIFALKDEGDLITQKWHGHFRSGSDNGRISQDDIDEMVTYARETIKRHHYAICGVSDGSSYEGTHYEAVDLDCQFNLGIHAHRRIYGECYGSKNLNFYMRPIWYAYQCRYHYYRGERLFMFGDTPSMGTRNAWYTAIRLHGLYFGDCPASRAGAWIIENVTDNHPKKNSIEATNGYEFANSSGDTSLTENDENVVAEILYYDGSIPAEHPTALGFPNSWLAEDIGLAMIRPGWTETEDPLTDVGNAASIKCGSFIGKRMAELFAANFVWKPEVNSGSGGFHHQVDNNTWLVPVTLDDPVNGLPVGYPQDAMFAMDHAKPDLGMITQYSVPDKRFTAHLVPGKEQNAGDHTFKWRLARQTRSHNTITIDNRGQISGEPAISGGGGAWGEGYQHSFSSSKARGDFQLAHNPDFLHVGQLMDNTLYANADFKDAYPQDVQDTGENAILNLRVTEMRRHYAFNVEDGTSAMVDTMTSTDSHDWEWNMTSTDGSTRDADNQWIKLSMKGITDPLYQCWAFLAPASTSGKYEAAAHNESGGDPYTSGISTMLDVNFYPPGGTSNEKYEHKFPWLTRITQTNGPTARFVVFGTKRNDGNWPLRPTVRSMAETTEKAVFRVGHNGADSPKVDIYLFHHHSPTETRTQAQGEDVTLLGEFGLIRRQDNQSGVIYNKTVLCNGTLLQDESRIMISTAGVCNSFEVVYTGTTKIEVTGKDLSSFQVYEVSAGAVTQVLVNKQSVNFGRNATNQTITVT